MDLSSLPESQQHQLQQLQQKFQEHQAERQEQEHHHQQQQLQIQQQQQIQPYASASNANYDPAQPQVQSYDPNHSYYYHQQPQYAQHQHYAYNQSGYVNAYHQPTIAAVQHQPAPVQPEPGLPVQSVATEQVGGSLQIMEGQNGYYHQQQQQGSDAAGYQGLNPAAAAAVAALSQLAQFAGTMSDAERAMTGERFGQMMGAVEPFFGQNIQVGQSSSRGGGGRRGGGPFRGGNRTPFRGRGRGRGRGGRSLQSVVNNADSIIEGEEPLDVNPGADAPAAELGMGTLPSVSAESQKAQPPQAKWYCELCCADCNSAEILEQHYNGKKHKKNMQKADKSKISYKLEFGISEQIPIIGPHQEVIKQSGDGQVPRNLPSEISTGENEKNVKLEQNSDSVQLPQQSENTQVTENFTSEIYTGENDKNVQIEQNSDSGQVQLPAEGTSDLQMNNQLNQVKRGTKRKIRGGRGGKITRSFESSRRPNVRPMPKVVIPLICDLCNVKCDTEEVFERHLAGKKHMSKVKRFEGHHAMYGPMVQALYPPNPMTQTLYSHPQVQQPPPFYATQDVYPYMYPQPNQAMLAPIHMNRVPMPEGMVSYPPQNNSTIGNEQVNVGTSAGHV